MEKKSALRRLTDKLYGGLNMSWPAVILFAIGTAIVTAIFLIVPVFEGTSFERMGETFEAWIFFAILIMANCRKPLESAVKTFVFFLISQPLIYLLQVPFSWMGWGLFGYYKFWFIWTICTFPMAYVGWYIRKKNWLSLLILAPILYVLTVTYVEGFQNAVRQFPHLIVMALFCLGQVLLYLYTFTSNIWQKLLGFLVPLAAVVIVLLARPQVDLTVTEPLPGDPSFSEEATVTVSNSNIANVQLHDAEEGIIYIKAQAYGTTTFTVTDGGTEYRYTLEIYDDNGVSRTRIAIDDEAGPSN